MSRYAWLAQLLALWLSKALVLDAPLKALEYRFRNLASMLADLLQVAGLGLIELAAASDNSKRGALLLRGERDRDHPR